MRAQKGGGGEVTPCCSARTSASVRSRGCTRLPPHPHPTRAASQLRDYSIRNIQVCHVRGDPRSRTRMERLIDVSQFKAAIVLMGVCGGGGRWVGGWVGGREGGEWLAASAALRPRVAQLAHPLPPAASHRLPACLEPHAVRIGQRLAARAGNDGLPRPLRQIRCGWLASSWLLWTRPIWCSPRRAAHCLPRQHACARIGAGRACNHQCCSRLAALASPPPRPPPRSKRSLAG